MEDQNKSVLAAMIHSIPENPLRELSELADRLTILFDQLTFYDPEWYDQFTQHLVTLDSASTYRPYSQAATELMEAAVHSAINQIKRLVMTKTIAYGS